MFKALTRMCNNFGARAEAQQQLDVSKLSEAEATSAREVLLPSRPICRAVCSQGTALC